MDVPQNLHQLDLARIKLVNLGNTFVLKPSEKDPSDYVKTNVQVPRESV